MPDILDTLVRREPRPSYLTSYVRPAPEGPFVGEAIRDHLMREGLPVASVAVQNDCLVQHVAVKLMGLAGQPARILRASWAPGYAFDMRGARCEADQLVAALKKAYEKIKAA